MRYRLEQKKRHTVVHVDGWQSSGRSVNEVHEDMRQALIAATLAGPASRLAEKGHHVIIGTDVHQDGTMTGFLLPEPARGVGRARALSRILPNERAMVHVCMQARGFQESAPEVIEEEKTDLSPDEKLERRGRGRLPGLP